MIILSINAVFYKTSDELNTYEKHVSAPYIRGGYKFDKAKKCYITVSGLGFYDLFVNGKKITKGLLAPYISNPDDIVYFDRYDVTSLTGEAGETAIGLILGNGMQNCPGGRVWDFDIAPFRNPPCFALLVTEADGEGNEKTLDIGASFRFSPSPVIFDDLRSGCFYDAGKEIKDWNKPGFDFSAWDKVRKADRPRGEYRYCQADPIEVYNELKAAEIRPAVLDDRLWNRENMRLDTQYKFNKLGKEGIMYDFGINSAGIVRLKISGRPGQEIYIQFCEHMTRDGRPSYVNSGSFYPDGYGQSLLYICRGDEEEIFEPAFCYYGFRYAVVFGLEQDQIKDDTLVFLQASSRLTERGNFTCSDEIMSTLGKMIRNSDLSNFWYFPTDCPHREKNGWTGDAAVSAERMLLTLTPEKAYTEWLRNICKSQRSDGMLPGIIPTGGWGFEWGNGPAWDNVLSEICWQIYRLRGDIEPARECADSLLRYLAYISKRRNGRGLCDFGLGDWLQPRKGAGSPVAPEALTNTVISVYIAFKSEKLFEALGLELYRDFARRLKEELRKAVRDNFIDFGSMTALPRCQTAQAMCIYYGIFDESEMPAAYDSLVKIVEDDGEKINCGMLGLRVIFHALSDCGRGDLAFRMITRTDYPSYGMFVKRGMTSVPENFKEDEDIDSPDSLNHHFFGDISSWFIQRVAGIGVNPYDGNPCEFLIFPDFIPALDSADAFYDSPCGRVSVGWERDGEKVRLEIAAPEGASGYIRLPEGFVFDAQTDSRRDGSNYIPLEAGEYICRTIV